MDFETLDAEQAINKISNIVDQSHDPAHKFKMLEALRDKALATAQNSEGEVSAEAQRGIVILERMMQEAQEEQKAREVGPTSSLSRPAGTALSQCMRRH